MSTSRRPSGRRTRFFRSRSSIRMPTLPALMIGLFLGVSPGVAPSAAAGPFVDAGYAPSAMTAWATDVEEIVRGAMDISNPELGVTSHGVPENLLGPSTASPTDVVSLGDGGWATLYFDSGIRNGPDDDFAVFEYAFADLEGFFGELGFVEVSSDGLEFARFDSDALNPNPVGAFDYIDPTDYHGLAGRHVAGVGTGFDLGNLALDPLVLSGMVDLNDIRYVRVIDVVGNGSTFDGAGNPIYDPFATPFAEGGFDLEAIGVIHVPEPERAEGLATGLLGLLVLAQRRRRGRRHVRGAAVVVAMTTLAMVSSASAITAGFEDLGLGPESFENGSGLSGGYTSGGIFFENEYTAAFDSFTGFAASTTTDNTTPGFSNQFSNITGSGAGGSEAFGIAFLSGRIVLPTMSLVAGAELTNTTYAALSMRDGDAFAKKFGGDSGDDPDFFRLLVEGFDASGQTTGVVELMLADYRFADPSQDYILDEWVFLDLMGLGPVKELSFRLESSDVGSFGINTPQYFAIDDITLVPEPGIVCLLGLGLGLLSRQPRGIESSRR